MSKFIGLNEIPDEKSLYSGCIFCIHNELTPSDIFGNVDICKHNPQPENYDEVIDFDEPCKYKEEE